MKKELSKLLYGTDVTAPADIETNKELSVKENTVADPCDLLIITKRANGQSRGLKPEEIGTPYAIICERDDTPQNALCPILYTENARETLAYIYCNLYGADFSKIKIIGITGTNGKTATALMLKEILTKSGAKVGLISTGLILAPSGPITDSFYSSTTPDPALLYKCLGRFADEGCDYAVMEVSSHSLKLSKLAPLHFRLCAFTNLSEEHRDFHPDMQDYYETKLSLFNICDEGVFNLDDKYSRRAYLDAKCKKHSVGILWDAESYATDVDTSHLDKSFYYYREESLICPIRLGIGGSFNVYNSLMAVKCARVLGIRPCVIKDALGKMQALPGRMECLRGGDVYAVIDYAHTPKAFENVLRFAKRSLKPGQKMTVLFGCGGERDFEKRAEVGRIASMYAHKIILTEDNSRSERTCDIISDILKGILNLTPLIIENRKDAVRRAILDAEKGEVLLFLGKGCEGYIVNCTGKHPYDERALVKSLLLEREARCLENKA